MKNKLILAGGLLVLLFSCTKEKSDEGGNAKTENLLIRTVAKLGNDSVTNSYGYDAGKRLVQFQTTATFQGFGDNQRIRFVRNGAGVIQQVVEANDELRAVGIDSLVYKMNYDAGKSRYTSRVATFSVPGATFKDSIAYTYDASGRIVKEEEFVDDAFSGGYEENIKSEYSYDGAGNLIKAEAYEFDPVAGKYHKTSITTYEYDTNVNPLKLTVEAFIIQNPQMTSAHNATKISVTDATGASAPQTTTITYTYNSNKKPVTAVLNLSGLPVPFAVTFVYK